MLRAGEPEVGDAVEHPALVGNGIGQHHIERGQPIRSDDQQCRCIDGVDVAHLALVQALEPAQCGAVHGGWRHALATIAALSAADTRTSPTRYMAMNWNGKVAGRLLGRLALASVGAALGALRKPRPHAAAALAEAPPDPQTLEAIGKRFFRANFAVMGHLAKGDGRISEAEIAAASAFMDELGLDEAHRREAIACFTRGKQPDYDYRAELPQLAGLCRGRPDLARLFLEVQVRIALAGNDLQGQVHLLVRRLAAALGFSSLELLQIEAVLRIPQLRGLYGGSGSRAPAAGRALEEGEPMLETRAAASDEEVANAYRRQLQRHHPDKLKAHGLPESMLAHAKQRTQQIIEAWEIIRTRRN